MLIRGWALIKFLPLSEYLRFFWEGGGLFEVERLLTFMCIRAYAYSKLGADLVFAFFRNTFSVSLKHYSNYTPRIYFVRCWYQNSKGKTAPTVEEVIL